MHPEVFVLGGPNGAGKSTTAPTLLPERLDIEQFVNADMIARGLSPFSPASGALEGVRIMLRRIHQLRNLHVSFLQDAQQSGYIVHVIYIWVSSVELAVSRVAARVRQGGHDVPVETIKRRYQRGLVNFFRLYQPLADSWTLCDNSGDELVMVAHDGKGAEPTILLQERFDTIRNQADHAA